MAIDVEALVRTVYRGFARPAVGPVLSGMWAFNRELEPLEHDPARARELLAEAGWSDSDGDGVLDREGEAFTFELMSNSENQTRQDICILVQQQLQQVGVRAIPRFVEWGTQLARLQEGSFEAVVHRWQEPTQVDLEELWKSPPEDGASLNYCGYSNPEVDRLIELANSAPDIESQKPFLHRIQEIIVDEQPYTFLVESVRLDGLSTRVHNAVINNATPYFNLDQWTIEPDPHANPAPGP
jgi:peptide/nickel transport system substrate-binding protein